MIESIFLILIIEMTKEPATLESIFYPHNAFLRCITSFQIYAILAFKFDQVFRNIFKFKLRKI